MTDTRYLIDNNALLALGRTRRESELFKRTCHVSADVAREAGPRWPETAPREPVTPLILDRLAKVLRTLRPGATDLVDLYANKGTADPVLVATALVLQEATDQTLFPQRWMIVTHDKALRRCAEEHGLDWFDPEDLKDMIDQSMS